MKRMKKSHFIIHGWPVTGNKILYSLNIHACLYACVYSCTCLRMYVYMVLHASSMYVCLIRQINIWTDGWVDGWTCRWLDRQMDLQIEQWMDGYIDICILTLLQLIIVKEIDIVMCTKKSLNRAQILKRSGLEREDRK